MRSGGSPEGCPMPRRLRPALCDTFLPAKARSWQERALEPGRPRAAAARCVTSSCAGMSSIRATQLLAAACAAGALLAGAWLARRRERTTGPAQPPAKVTQRRAPTFHDSRAPRRSEGILRQSHVPAKLVAPRPCWHRPSRSPPTARVPTPGVTVAWRLRQRAVVCALTLRRLRLPASPLVPPGPGCLVCGRRNLPTSAP